ncbi:MAG: hypothetical protein SGJ09_13490 [Phycisphaerae bacterium]|nr:hypothetical protein [Phycisphaerae bacterium]
MIGGHATLDITWNGRGHVATGEREHVIGLSVADNGEKGVVARWRFDGEILVVDGEAFGYLPLFVAQAENRIIVGTSPIALVAAGAPGDIDREAVGLFLRIGFYLGERTPFKHIRVAPRGKRLTWTRGVSSVSGAGMTIVPASIRTVEEGVAGYCDLFRTAMRRRPPTQERFAMPLSGGRDSRMMLLDSLELGHRPTALVNLAGGEHSDHPDAVIARHLASRVGIPLVAAAARSPWIESEARKHVTGGLLVLEHTWMMPLWDTLRASYPCWYDGLGAGAITRGDLCKESCWTKYQRGEWTEFLREFASYALGVSDETVRRLARIADWIEPSEESAVAVLREELDVHAGAANPMTSFSFTNWGGRAIGLNPFMLCAPVRDIHTPFMDADLTRFLLGYPIDLALKDDLQTACVRRMHPAFADVPFDKDLPKWKRKRKPFARAISGRLATVRHMAASAGRFRSVGMPAAIKGDARLVPILTVLAMLERASTAHGAKELIDEFGFDSAADRGSLARHRVP